MFFIFIVVMILAGWALRLMQRALSCQEFSLMLAGFLVASSAVALVAVYYLMSDYMGYMASLPPSSVVAANYQSANDQDRQTEALISMGDRPLKQPKQPKQPLPSAP